MLCIANLKSFKKHRFSFPSEAKSVPQARWHSKGFTLVEVLLSIGIVSFVFLPMSALLMMGMNTSRQAVDLTIESQIVQQVSSRALQTDFSELPTLPTTSFPQYYDVQGKQTDQKSMIYKVNIQIPIDASTSKPCTQLPGGAVTTKLATVTVTITNTKRVGAASKYIVLVGDNGL